MSGGDPRSPQFCAMLKKQHSYLVIDTLLKGIDGTVWPSLMCIANLVPGMWNLRELFGVSAEAGSRSIGRGPGWGTEGV